MQRPPAAGPWRRRRPPGKRRRPSDPDPAGGIHSELLRPARPAATRLTLRHGWQRGRQADRQGWQRGRQAYRQGWQRGRQADRQATWRMMRDGRRGGQDGVKLPPAPDPVRRPWPSRAGRRAAECARRRTPEPTGLPGAPAVAASRARQGASLAHDSGLTSPCRTWQGWEPHTSPHRGVELFTQPLSRNSRLETAAGGAPGSFRSGQSCTGRVRLYADRMRQYIVPSHVGGCGVGRPPLRAPGTTGRREGAAAVHGPWTEQQQLSVQRGYTCQILHSTEQARLSSEHNEQMNTARTQRQMPSDACNRSAESVTLEHCHGLVEGVLYNYCRFARSLQWIVCNLTRLVRRMSLHAPNTAAKSWQSSPNSAEWLYETNDRDSYHSIWRTSSHFKRFIATHSWETESHQAPPTRQQRLAPVCDGPVSCPHPSNQPQLQNCAYQRQSVTWPIFPPCAWTVARLACCIDPLFPARSCNGNAKIAGMLAYFEQRISAKASITMNARLTSTTAA